MPSNASTLAALAPSPPCHNPEQTQGACLLRLTALPKSPELGQISAAKHSGRSPLPTQQPKTNSTAKATGRPSLEARVSAPPPPPSQQQQQQQQQQQKMAMAAVISHSPTGEAPKISMTTKEWVIPPRPKPGRKPATDTPPTKRKAQNRAAQRAFRERRAARVGELEQQLDEVRDVYQKEENNLKEKVHSLELELESFRSRCSLLQNMLNQERQERIHAETQVESFRRRQGEEFSRSHSMIGPNNPSAHSYTSVQQSSRPSDAEGQSSSLAQDRHYPVSQIITPPEADAAITCGNCSPNGPCACAEEVLATAGSGCGKCGFGASCQCLTDDTGNKGQELKRSASPLASPPDDKRRRDQADTAVAIETDFTTSFSKKATPVPATQSPYDQPSFVSEVPSGNLMSYKENCGFCKDGTYCVCAEDAAGMATPAMTPTPPSAPALHQARTPPPSEPDVFMSPLAVEMTADGAVKLPRRILGKKPSKASTPAPVSPAVGCGVNGPGTCAQCQADPKSGLFCRLMNAKYSREEGSSSSGCCGGRAASGGCCKGEAAKEKITLPSLPSLGLSCAEAYQTLSSHRNFSKAADDISSWLPKLKTTTHTAGRGPVPNRQAIEVEAASIMSVLKEFDVRFGREA